MSLSKSIDTPFWLMIVVIMSQIVAGILVDKFSDLGIGMPVTVVGVVMILALCFVKALGTTPVQSVLRKRRLRKAAESEANDGSTAQGSSESPAAIAHEEDNS